MAEAADDVEEAADDVEDLRRIMRKLEAEAQGPGFLGPSKAEALRGMQQGRGPSAGSPRRRAQGPGPHNQQGCEYGVIIGHRALREQP